MVRFYDVLELYLDHGSPADVFGGRGEGWEDVGKPVWSPVRGVCYCLDGHQAPFCN
jgi:hypothetical protein